MFTMTSHGRLVRLLIAFACLFACTSTDTAASDDVLRVARSYQDGGGYDKSWKGTGVPESIEFSDTLILKKGNGSYCCGYTLAVVLQAAEQRGLLDGKTPDEIRKFQKQWYGATVESRETLCALAVKTLGIGDAIAPEDAQPGDFLQFWRNNGSGHSVVFLEWINDNGERVGIKYRSSQGATNGIGDRIEYLAGVGDKNDLVVPARMYFCRLAKGTNGARR